MTVNPVAKNLNKFNKPSAVRPKKGKGSYRRRKKNHKADADKDRYESEDETRSRYLNSSIRISWHCRSWTR